LRLNEISHPAEEERIDMRIHTYAAGTPTAMTHPDVDGGARLREFVVIEAADIAYKIGDGTEIDVDLTVAEIFGGGPGEVIVHGCKEITVTVDYAGKTVPVRARPSQRLSEVRAQAVHELVQQYGLDPKQAADLVLRLPGTTAELPEASPVGAYVPRGTCALTLDLVHAVRPQG
jgi:hypothetical protein